MNIEKFENIALLHRLGRDGPLIESEPKGLFPLSRRPDPNPCNRGMDGRDAHPYPANFKL